jgi:hypothetical protein
MPPLTLTILASVLKLHGPDATTSNDHKGIDLLLGELRRLGEQGSPPLLQPGAKRERFADKKKTDTPRQTVNEDDKASQKADDDLKSVRDHSGAISIKGNSHKNI